ncbi:MAG TPA: D-2-hydroxyacid dehydrogenase [Humisphaera sp.]|nr:D-2-hydroxyacid dehydrogenase [Humisphaera sp.]
MDSLTIWCNAKFPEPAMARLRERVGGHRLLLPQALQKSNLAAGAADPMLAEADIAFGQPDPVQAMQLPRLKWVHLTTAGYTRYDREDLRTAFRARGAVLTNSSMVYADPCAQHAVASMFALARRLPQCMDDQRAAKSWHQADHRARSQVLTGQSVLILGFGAIARRLVELLAPLRMDITAVRRRVNGDEPCRVVPTEQVDQMLGQADHVMNILPQSLQTEGFMTRARIEKIKSGAAYYNIGRGSTQDQAALVDALKSGRLSGVYLDVTDPEPLPPEHPLWTAPNCYITPHTAGGRAGEFDAHVEHFTGNLERFLAGKELLDRIV